MERRNHFVPASYPAGNLRAGLVVCLSGKSPPRLRGRLFRPSPLCRRIRGVGNPFSAGITWESLRGSLCYAVDIPQGTAPPEGMVLEGLRQVYGRLDEDLFWLAARAVQIVDWDRTHQFCSRCGNPTVLRQTERSRECPKCGQIHFPRLAPAVIVCVERETRFSSPGPAILPPAFSAFWPVSSNRARRWRKRWPGRSRRKAASW